MIAEDFASTIKQLADAGFQTIELCSPVGYVDSGFAGLSKYTGTELKRILGDAGVTSISSHFSIEELRENQEDLNRACRAPKPANRPSGRSREGKS